ECPSRILAVAAAAVKMKSAQFSGVSWSYSQLFWLSLHHWPPLVVYIILTVVRQHHLAHFVLESANAVSTLVPRVGGVPLELLGFEGFKGGETLEWHLKRNPTFGGDRAEKSMVQSLCSALISPGVLLAQDDKWEGEASQAWALWRGSGRGSH
ncbi:hypothetical protein GBF38_018934, partial [Nibea albiflora]